MLPKKLIELRKQKKLTQEAVAKKLGIPRGTYSNYELGKREPDLETLKRIADFHGVSIDELLGREAYSVAKETSSVAKETEAEYQALKSELSEFADNKRPTLWGRYDLVALLNLILGLPDEDRRKFVKALEMITDVLEKRNDSERDF